MVLYPPHTTIANVPPLGQNGHAALPRCLGGCRQVMRTNRIVCDVCWNHLDAALQRNVTRFRRRNAEFRQVITDEVERVCAEARRRAR